MSRRGRPPAVTRYLWAPAWWPLLAVGLFGSLFVLEDLPASRAEVDPAEEAVVTGTAVRKGGDVEVRYRHPVTEQVVEAPLHVVRADLEPDPGEAVSLVVRRDDPLSVAVHGDDFPLTTNLLVYGLWVGGASLPVLARWFGTRRAERLAAGPEPTFAMSGALVASGHLRRCHLELYPLDARPGAEPLCSVRVLTTAQAPLAGRTFPLEVKGSPRPFGRVVAQAGGTVLWPAGRALGRRGGRGRPAAAGGPPVPLRPTTAPAVRWRARRRPFFEVAAWLTLAAAVVFGAVLASTLSNAADADRTARHGRPVIGEVVGREGDTVVVLRYEADGSQATRAPADFPRDYRVGIRFPIRLDPDDPGRARLDAEPYDVREPLVWGGLPLAAAAWWLARRWRTWRRNLRAARRGPWWRAEGRLVANDGRVGVVCLSNGEDVVAAVPVGPPPDTGPAPTPVVVAGDRDPSGPAAVWWEGTEPVTSMGATVVPPRT